MRHRLDSELNDCTVQPHHYLTIIDDRLMLEDPPSALYDDALWAELEEARARLRVVQDKVATACVAEPLDDMEVRIGRELDALMRKAQWDEADCAQWKALEHDLREHARMITKATAIAR